MNKDKEWETMKEAVKLLVDIENNKDKLKELVKKLD